MYKSAAILTFGVLMSSLVMLAVMPFFNQNNFSNIAMAQGYDDYNYDYDDSYSTYPTENKKYECRTGPFEGFLSSVDSVNYKFKDDDRKDHRD